MFAESTIADGHLFLSDLLLLVAVILFVIAGAMRYTVRGNPPIDVPAVLVAFGLACTALGWMVL